MPARRARAGAPAVLEAIESCRPASRLALALVFALSLPGLPGGGAAFGASEAETLRKALEAEKQKSEALEADLEKTRSGMQDRIDKAREEAAARIEELFASVTWKSNPEVAVLRKKLDSAGAEIAGLAKAKENTKAYATRLENRLRGMNEMVKELETAARAEAARVRGRLDAKDKEIEGLQAAVAEAEAARSEIAEIAEQARAKQDVWANRLIGANKSALIAASNAQALREKLDGVQAKLDEVGGERDVLKQELETAEIEIGQRIDKVFAAASGDAASQVDSLRKELEASNKQIASLEATSQSSSCAQAALGASFTLEDGRQIEGEIVYARGSTLMIRDAEGALVQVGRSAVERVELEAGKRGLVAGALKSWDQGVYEIDTPDSILKIKDRKIVAERRVLTKITVAAAEGRENAAEVVFELGLSKPAQDEVLLIYSTADGTAMAGTDYEPARGSVILKPGATSATVSVTLLDDKLVEGDESFALLVTSDMDLSEVKVHRADAKILDDEPPQAAQQ